MGRLLEVIAQYEVKVGPLPHVDAGSTQVQAILTIVFTVIGALSVLMFAVGGLRYISSQGDPQAAAKAKGTLIYALVGVLVSMAAVGIVQFVVGKL